MWPMQPSGDKFRITEPILKQLGAKPALRAEFIKFFELCYIDEIPLFLFAVSEFRGRPTLDEFAKVYNEYVKLGSPKQVNISDKRRVPLDVFMAAHKNAVGNTEGSHNFPLPVPRAKFDECFADMLNFANLSMIRDYPKVFAELEKFLQQNVIDKPIGGKLWNMHHA